MSDWVSISLKSAAADKHSAIFAIQNTTLQSMRFRAVPAGVEMVGAGPFEEGFFHVEPTLFNLEPGEAREIMVSLTPRAPVDRKVAVRLRVEKADVTDHFEHGPGVELGVDAVPRKTIPPWVFFAIGGAVIVLVVGIILYVTRGCSSNAECAAGFQCKERACMCGNQEECPGNSPICFQNQCKPDCTASGAVCSSGQYCDPQVKVCRAGCDDNGDCAKGLSCNVATHQCKCGNASSCQRDEVCAENQCRDGCGPSKKCATGQHCDAAAGACMPGCAADSDCIAGFACKNNVCMCGPRKSCASNQVCFENQCRISCGPGKPNCAGEGYCFDNIACMAPCTTNTDCPAHYKCDDTSHECKCAKIGCGLVLGHDRWETFREKILEREINIPPHIVPSAIVSPAPLPTP